MKCRACGGTDFIPFIDLGSAPLSNAYLTRAALCQPEKWYPLRVLTCTECWLVQTEDYAHQSDLFSPDYAYFSSISSTWVSHARQYVDAVVGRFGLGPASFVVEVASNDGYLLQFVRDRGIPCLGIEPTHSTASAARAKGIDVREEFFTAELADRLADEGTRADLIIANNVLAHVPDINDFTVGCRKLLKNAGVATFEFPHLLQLIRNNQFDTIYHEHFSYLSVTALTSVFSSAGLCIFDADVLPTHGGSVRLYVQKTGASRPTTERLHDVVQAESRNGITTREFYAGFQVTAERAKNRLVSFLVDANEKGHKVAAYGAAAKGNTLLNFAGVKPDLLKYVVDRSPFKQMRYLPGSRIPIVAEEVLVADKPDYVLLLPWNIRSELTEQLSYVRTWNARFVTAIPALQVHS